MRIALDPTTLAQLDTLARHTFGRRGVHVFVVRGAQVEARWYPNQTLPNLGSDTSERDGLARALTTYDPRVEYLYVLCVPDPARTDTMLVQWQRRPWSVQALVA